MSDFKPITFEDIVRTLAEINTNHGEIFTSEAMLLLGIDPQAKVPLINMMGDAGNAGYLMTGLIIGLELARKGR